MTQEDKALHLCGDGGLDYGLGGGHIGFVQVFSTSRLEGSGEVNDRIGAFNPLSKGFRILEIDFHQFRGEGSERLGG